MLNREQQEAVFRGKPIQWNGLTLFPILVSDFLQFSDAKLGLMVAQQTLPVKYVCMRFLEALYAMDYDAKQNGNAEGGGLFLRLMIFLRLALRLPVLKKEDGREYVELYLATKPDEPRKLLSIKVKQDEAVAEITPKNFKELREILAAQNGITLPDELANPDLIQAERDIAAHNAPNLKPDFEAWIYSVAVKTGTPPESIYDWTVRRFGLVDEAITRTTGHLIAALTEASGGKYKDGNPYPSWKYDREEGCRALISFDALQSSLSGAVEKR